MNKAQTQLLDNSYKGAWDEANMRTLARDRVLLYQLVLSFTLIGFAINNTNYRTLALVVPIIGLVTTLMQAHHDIVVGLLTRYLSAYAKQAERTSDWHFRSDRLGGAIWAGILHSLASLIAVTLTSALSLAITKDLSSPFYKILWGFSWLATGTSFLILVGLRVYRIQQYFKLCGHKNALSSEDAAA